MLKKILFILILVVIGLGTIGYISQKIDSENEFSGWKTYRNKEFGFKFKYPPYFGVPPLSKGDEYHSIEHVLDPANDVNPNNDYAHFKLFLFPAPLNLFTHSMRLLMLGPSISKIAIALKTLIKFL
ncbi:MAG: hypothetical protein A2939_02945 [Parcubacteria group bacterium RIFCSPLOWO2_01_FULL_48_18]|nr:MAG: hypothetical protein A2939_02945 [Parcubacteria group bacterium RIFCSPLOWO2_01_FULL_48_18]OHB24469.1 MAG: hypothetical protein A3J67_05535 [Parcubacteria group bacterium RIFCSPHIGHO2_02_FULL_48_10b]